MNTNIVDVVLRFLPDSKPIVTTYNKNTGKYACDLPDLPNIFICEEYEFVDVPKFKDVNLLLMQNLLCDYRNAIATASYNGAGAIVITPTHRKLILRRDYRSTSILSDLTYSEPLDIQIEVERYRSRFINIGFAKTICTHIASPSPIWQVYLDETCGSIYIGDKVYDIPGVKFLPYKEAIKAKNSYWGSLYRELLDTEYNVYLCTLNDGMVKFKV